MSQQKTSYDRAILKQKIKIWGRSLGFDNITISNCDLSQADKKLEAWLSNNYHGSMSYLENNRDLRRQPELLVANTKSIIVARINYYPLDKGGYETLQDKTKAYISRYALGRDYHRLVRKKLKKLAQMIEDEIGTFCYRPFADSAPVFEKPLAAKSGLGWMGKNTLILNRESGSYFFLGTLFTDLTLPLDSEIKNHCGSCTACIDICPTQAIVAPYQLDARRCISYLTIENKGSIPIEFRKAIGNRVFGCDDCQLICPWNKYAKITQEEAFKPRHNLQHSNLVELFLWSEQQYNQYTEGSAIRRCGYQGWLRNLAVALGNAPSSNDVIDALSRRKNTDSAMLREHIIWALQQHTH
jgi:epoxyqueuosine reductase